MPQKSIFIAELVIGLAMTFLIPKLSLAKYIYQGDDFQRVSADGVMIDSDDTGTTGPSYIIQFGNLIAQTLKWDITNSRFDLSNALRINGNLAVIGQIFTAEDHSAAESPGVLNLGRHLNTWQTIGWNNTTNRYDISAPISIAGNIDLNSNQLVNTRLENSASIPTCNAGTTGLQFFNTVTNRPYICNGSMMVSAASKTYVGNTGSAPTQTTDLISEILNGTTAATNTMYLTDNGLVTGNKIFTTVYSVDAAASTNNSIASAPFLAGYSYNSGTGLLTLTFVESAGILIGGQGLEAASSGTPYTVHIIGK